MERQDPPEHRDKEEPDEDTNILRFPRDWFGPPEELVPFGPRADLGPDVGPGPSPARSESACSPPSADAFWTEESAKVQGAVRAPEAAVGIGAPSAAAASRAASRLTGIRHSPSGRIVLACSAALVLFVASLMALGGAGGRQTRSTPRIAAIQNRTWSAISGSQNINHRAATAERTAGRRRFQGRQGTPPATATRTPAESSPAPASESANAASAQTPPSPASAESVQSRTTGQTGASPASAQASHQPAFGPSGVLGPGSSPDS